MVSIPAVRLTAATKTTDPKTDLVRTGSNPCPQFSWVGPVASEGRQPSAYLSGAQAPPGEDYIHANLECELRLLDLSAVVGLSRGQFLRKFSNTFGITPHQYVMRKRVGMAMRLLLEQQRLSQIAEALGFASQAHFCGMFRKFTSVWSA